MNSSFSVPARKKTCLGSWFQSGLYSVLAAVVLIGLHRSEATAALLFEESFEYVSNQSINGLAGGTGFVAGTNGTWRSPFYPDQINAGGLSFSNLAVSGNAVLGHVAGGDDDSHQSVRRINPVTVSSDAPLWFSFLIRLDSIPSGSSVSDFEGYVALMPLTTGYSLSMGVSRGSSNFGIRSNVQNTLVVAEGTMTVGKTYFIVTHIEPGKSVTLYIDPPPGVNMPPAEYQAAIASLSLPPQFSRVGVFTNGADAPWIFDELRLGTSYLDVAPIPEPSETSLMIFGVGALLLLKHRRQIFLTKAAMKL